MRRIAVVFGTRPEAIKLAPVITNIREAPTLEPIVIVTGQHREMLDDVLDVFDIQPQEDLGIMTPRQSLDWIATRTISGLSPILDRERPDVLMVQGDTTTAFASALAAFHLQIPVVHVEAGLRSGHRYSPFPEEMNRRLTTQLTDLHLAPTQSNRANLIGEGVHSDQIVVTGNTVIDALLLSVAKKTMFSDPRLAELDKESRRVVLVTAHRRESWEGGLEGIARALVEIARQHSDVVVVYPIHRNPVVRDVIEPRLRGLPNVLLVDPLPYGEFARLMDRAFLILTDSGGIQEEAPTLSKPLLVMRHRSERPEVIDEGAALLVGTEAESIIFHADALLGDSKRYDEMASARSPYGDGHASARIRAALLNFFGEGPPALEFGMTPGPAAAPAAT